jgi:hypothetical protein
MYLPQVLTDAHLRVVSEETRIVPAMNFRSVEDGRAALLGGAVERAQSSEKPSAAWSLFSPLLNSAIYVPTRRRLQHRPPGLEVGNGSGFRAGKESAFLLLRISAFDRSPSN